MTFSSVFRVSGTRWGRWLILFGLCAVVFPSHVAMGEPIIVHEAKVYFAQADGSLTVLDLDTGSIIERRTERNSDLFLRHTEAGLIVTCWDKIELVDLTTFEVKWSIPKRTLISPRLITHTSDTAVFEDLDRIFAIKLRSGIPVWSVDGSGEGPTQSGEMLLFNVEEKDKAGKILSQTVYLIEIDTGQILRQHTLEEPYTSQSRRYFAYAEERIYIFDNTFGDVIRDGISIETNLLNADGSIEPVPLKRIASEVGPLIQIGDKYFGRSGYPVEEANAKRSISGESDPEFAEDGLEVFEYLSPLDNAAVTRLQVLDRGHELRLVVPHLRPNSFYSYRIALTEDYILLYTTRGQVECLDRKTGRSRWLYVAPSNRGVISISGGYQIDMQECIVEFDAEKTDQNKRTPTIAVPADADWSVSSWSIRDDVTLIDDPYPFDPYKDVRGIVRAMRLSPYVYGLLCVGVFYAIDRQRIKWLGVSLAVLFCLPVPILLMYCGASKEASVLLLLEMLLIGLCVIWNAWRGLRNRLYTGPVVSACLVGLGLWWVWPVIDAVELMWGVFLF